MAVYFIQAGDADGLIKIGKSKNVPMRLNELQSGSSLPLRVLAVIEHAEDDKFYHPRFVQDWVRGEWFKPSQTLLSFINSIPKSKYTGLAYPPTGNPAIEELQPKGVDQIWKEAEEALAGNPHQDDLLAAFALLNPVEFARKMNSLGVSIAVKSKLLPLAVQSGGPCEQQEQFFPKLLKRTQANFWRRLSVESAERENAYAAV